MRESKFIIPTSIQSFNLSFLLLFHIISSLIPCIATLIPHIFRISTQIPRIPTLIFHTSIPFPFLVFPPLFSAFSSFRSPIPHFGFYR